MQFLLLNGFYLNVPIKCVCLMKVNLLLKITQLYLQELYNENRNNYMYYVYILCVNVKFERLSSIHFL